MHSGGTRFMKALDGLDPQALWRHFGEISRIPRESGNEAAIAGHVRTLASGLGLACTTDDAGNVIVKKPGTRGMPSLALQSHLDMVCEKDKSTPHDFSSDPIRLVRDGDWIRATGTTLGADNGIGVAAMLAIMEDTSLAHPDLELIFTVEEETGLTGAHALARESFSAHTLINLDSEDEGTFIIGCAGGVDTMLDLELDFMTVPEDTKALLLRIGGLRGGHSGVDIHRGLGNAIKLLARILHATYPVYGFSLGTFRGGSKHNAIPRDAEAVIHVESSAIGELMHETVRWNDILRGEFEHVDDGVALDLEVMDHGAPRVVVPADASKILHLLQALPHGPLHIDPGLDGTVVTSTNLAVCSWEGDSLIVTTSQRSIVGSALRDAAAQVASAGELTGCEVRHGHGYPAWRPNLSSPILATCTRLFSRVSGKEPSVRVVHAGLECAVIAERIEGLDMISFGPTIEQPHSPQERVSIESTGHFWEFLVELLKTMAGQ